MKPALEKVLDEKPVVEKEMEKHAYISSFSVMGHYRTVASPMKVELVEKIVTR